MKIIILLIVTLVQSIIAMCTSSFDINTISSGTQQKAEECKLHLLEPVNKTNEKQKS